MDSDLTRKAIDAALRRDWKLAIATNLQLTKQNPKDVDTLNRLGRAYLETGQKTKSLETYQKVLKIDKFNSIAHKSIELLKTSRVAHHNTASVLPTSAPIFLEEPGVTKTVTLTRLGDAKIISRLHPGDPVLLSPREHCVSVTSTAHENLGRLPDDLASRMREFMKAGNKYDAWIRSIDMNGKQQSLRIFIKETSRAPQFRNTPSFPLTEKLSYAAFTPPNLVHDEKPLIMTPEEDQDVYSRSTYDVDEEPELIPVAED